MCRLHSRWSHLLHFQVDAPDDEVVGRLFTGEVRVLKQVFLTIIVFPQHPKLLYLFLVVLGELLLHKSITEIAKKNGKAIDNVVFMHQ